MRISDWSSDVCSSDLKKLLPLFRIEEHHPNWNLSPGVVGVISHRLPPQYLARHRIRYKQRRATRPIVAAFEHDALPKDAAPAGCDAFGTPGGLRLIAIDFGLRVAINSPERVGSHWLERANGVAVIDHRFGIGRAHA